MKHFKHLLLVLIALVAFSCGKSEPENTEPTPAPKPTDKIELAAGTDLNPVISTDGGTLSVTFNASTAWSAQAVNDRADGWCSVSPTSGSAGSGTITITAKANTEPDERSASINIKAGTATQTIKVTQKQKDALTVTSSTFEVPAEGKDINIEVKANVNVTYKIDEQCSSWIKYVSTKALKTSTLTFAVSKNENVEKREGKIIIGEGALCDTIKIFQAGEAPSIVLNKDEYIAKSEGETFAIEVASNIDVTYLIEYTKEDGTLNTDSENWLQENKTKAMNTNTYYFTAATNEEYDNREARIVFANKENNLSDTIRVTQLQKDAIVLAKNEYEFGVDGGNLDFEIQTNIDVKVEISDNAKSWITQIETRGLQTKSLCFNVAKCNETDERQGTIKLSGREVEQIITVKQSGLKEILDMERAALIAFYNATGGDNWTNNENWCSDKPVDKWYGVRCNSVGFVTKINLPANNLSGIITDSIGFFTELEYFNVSVNLIGGQIPKSFSKLIALKELYLAHNMFEGEILKILKNIQTLETLIINNNNFTGAFADDCSFPNLRGIDILNNRFSGNLPISMIELELKAQDPYNGCTCRLEPQQAGYGFTAAATKEMVNLGNNLYIHPAGIAIEYRMNEIKVLQPDDAEGVAKNIYNIFGDYFDFIVFLYNVDNMAEIAGEIAGQYNPYSNAISGIGRDIFSNAFECGSDGKLKGVLHLSDYRQIRGSFLHEIAHTWAALDFGQFSMNNDGTVEKDPVHWGVSSVDGRLGGFKLSSLQRNVDGISNKYKATCTNAGNDSWFYGNYANKKYAQLELYLMGMIPSSDVPDIHYFTELSGTPQEWIGLNGIFYAEKENILTIDDIIARFGPRYPDYTQSQKDFRSIVVVVTDKPVDDRRWATIEIDIREMQKKEESKNFVNFYEATGKRGTMIFDGLESLKR